MWKEYRLHIPNSPVKRADFLRQNGKYIYTIKQAQDLLQLMGAENYVESAKNFQYNEKAGWLKKNALSKYIDLLIEQIDNFSDV